VRAQPKYATQRDPSAPNAGAQVARIAALMGKPLMPWQRLVADVATEREADGTYRYDLVMVTVPRQAGKTTLLGAIALQRMLAEPGTEIQYTAQSGKDAGKRFRELVKLIQGSPLEEALSPAYRYSAGGMGIELENASVYRMFAPVVDAIHGDHPHMVLLDEIWAHSELLGDAIYEGAAIPAQSTLTGRAQNWFVSTMGTASSTFMKKWIERGRKGRPGMAYFEWGLADGASPYDLDAIAAFHPAVGYTQTAQAILDIGTGKGQGEDEGMSRAEYLRALCNVSTETLDPILSEEAWQALAAAPMQVPSRHEIAITYDVAPDNEAGRIMATWRDADGNPCTRHSMDGGRAGAAARVAAARDGRRRRRPDSTPHRRAAPAARQRGRRDHRRQGLRHRLRGAGDAHPGRADPEPRSLHGAGPRDRSGRARPAERRAAHLSHPLPRLRRRPDRRRGRAVAVRPPGGRGPRGGARRRAGGGVAVVIRLDKSRETVVVLCSHCISWRVLQLDAAAAWAAGAAHETSVHGGATGATRTSVNSSRRRA
jgi:hypothetical protein